MNRIRTWSPIPGKRTRRGFVLILCSLFALGLVACRNPQPIRLTVIADKQELRLQVIAQSMTVRELLQTLEIALGPLDRVEPDLYAQVADGMTVVVVRVQETFETERQSLSFAHRTLRSEGVPEGEHRLLQAGANGELEITYRIILEDGIEVSRQEVRREVLVAPVDEVVVVGVQKEWTSVPISGTIAYLSGGNAWLMRQSSDLRRNITGSGDLDRRVFALSADGSRLLLARTVADDDSLNSLWVARTWLVGEEPQSLDVSGVLWADWSPDGRRLAYSTAEKSDSVPGWNAHNDLWLLTLPEEGSEEPATVDPILPSTADIPYAWWGRTFAWSPDGQSLAYAQADQVGIVRLADHSLVPLLSFPPYRTRSHWAWVPTVSWSPDGQLLACVVHEGDVEGLDPEDSPIFNLWVVRADGTLRVRLVEEVGMWSAPRWSPAADGLLAYGQAQSPRNSQDSRYELFVIDRDGSNKRRLFPPPGWMGLIAPDVAWSPGGQALLFEYEGDLYRLSVLTGRMNRLTHDGQSSHPRWSQ
ncbi:MAG: G5 domain-containing protein [Anaerolineae bacterium]